ncbi:MAG: hypothetical protein GVY20_00640 [Bacteroidetes bacterium]|jgi:hypothetical protein|nr:hypothetical protein [Bacteroidota bacterium]
MASPKKRRTGKDYHEFLVVLGLALTAAMLIKLPEFFGFDLDENEGIYIRNFSLFVLPPLALYFTWKRRIEMRKMLIPGLAFLISLLFINFYPFKPSGDTETLAALHLPVALWLIVGIAFSGNNWSRLEKRMEFIRFSGELFIYYVLIGLGGMILTGFMALIFQTIEIDIEPFFESWILPCGITGAVIIASWLVEIKQGISENLAPLLSKLFTPLFAIVLITFLGTFLYTGRPLDIERDALIAFDMLLVLVLGLLIYSISAREQNSSPGLFDIIQVLLLTSALIADLIALFSISGRITDFGFTPNCTVALGLNLILLVNLSGSAVLYIQFLRKKSPFSRLERWQTAYLPVFAYWAALVVIIIPPLFGFS